MSRYKAMKYSLLLVAVMRPVALLAIFLTYAAQEVGVSTLAWMVAWGAAEWLPHLCSDPQEEEERAAGIKISWGTVALVVGPYLLISWLVDLKEVRQFFASLAPRLWDWRTITCVSLYCAWLLYSGLRKALAFRFEHLYPDLYRRTEPAVE